MEFTVVRAFWLRGGRDGEGYDAEPSLLEHGQRCCLGFLGQTCGLVSGSRLRSVEIALKVASEPSDCSPNTVAWPDTILTLEEGVPTQTELTRDIILANDDKSIPDDIREVKLTRLFAEGGITVKFVDE